MDPRKMNYFFNYLNLVGESQIKSKEITNTVSKKNISLEELKQLKKKYQITINGSKSDLANFNS